MAFATPHADAGDMAVLRQLPQEARGDPEGKGRLAGPEGQRGRMFVGIAATEASGTAERAAALEMVDELQSEHGKTPKTLGADKGYDSGEFFAELEKRSIEPHVPLVGRTLYSRDHSRRNPLTWLQNTFQSWWSRRLA